MLPAHRACDGHAYRERPFQPRVPRSSERGAGNSAEPGGRRTKNAGSRLRAPFRPLRVRLGAWPRGPRRASFCRRWGLNVRTTTKRGDTAIGPMDLDLYQPQIRGKKKRIVTVTFLGQTCHVISESKVADLSSS